MSRPDLVVLTEDGQVEERLLGGEEPQVLGGEALERGALAVVAVLRRHHRRAELLGEHGHVVVGDSVAGLLAAEAQEHRAGGVVVMVQELEVALLELAVVLQARSYTWHSRIGLHARDGIQIDARRERFANCKTSRGIKAYEMDTTADSPGA